MDHFAKWTSSELLSQNYVAQRSINNSLRPHHPTLGSKTVLVVIQIYRFLTAEKENENIFNFKDKNNFLIVCFDRNLNVFLVFSLYFDKTFQFHHYK